MSLKKVGVIGLTALTVLGGAIVSTTSADARPRGGWGHHHHHGGWHRGGGGWHRGGGWIGPAIIGGLALGALAAPHYAYGGPYHAYGSRCVLERRVRYTPYGPVVRRVRVCY